LQNLKKSGNIFLIVALGQHFLIYKNLGNYYKKQNQNRTRINTSIRARELRVIGAEGENVGVISLEKALQLARDAELDLIEISPNAKPPVAKIADYGKFLYDQKKKQKAAKVKAHNVEVKTIQVKVGTDENDLNIKAKKASEWLTEGHRIKAELFLPGRLKYMDRTFLEERLKRLLKLMSVDYKVASPAKKSPKGLTMIIEKR
jgi:translation initiation factor IF-3